MAAAGPVGLLRVVATPGTCVDRPAAGGGGLVVRVVFVYLCRRLGICQKRAVSSGMRVFVLGWGWISECLEAYHDGNKLIGYPEAASGCFSSDSATRHVLFVSNLGADHGNS